MGARVWPCAAGRCSYMVHAGLQGLLWATKEQSGTQRPSEQRQTASRSSWTLTYFTKKTLCLQVSFKLHLSIRKLYISLYFLPMFYLEFWPLKYFVFCTFEDHLFHGRLSAACKVEVMSYYFYTITRSLKMLPPHGCQPYSHLPGQANILWWGDTWLSGVIY